MKVDRKTNSKQGRQKDRHIVDIRRQTKTGQQESINRKSVSTHRVTDRETDRQTER